ncbi:mitochondrial cytochrome-like protein b2 [Mycena pura]|uniref:Mitochondrial cytochrome-like protein b2 n=1 Tax=Mycena pura TaxID=153505 RepID=A0AAD6UZ95_9AGAR|nr:mitochondrial cytochrome-like protein b2 [Mycena pura]
MALTISAHEVSKHNSLDSLWTVVDGVVYDLTEFAPSHPGGVNIILEYAGRDATAAYSAVHSPFFLTTLPPSKILGRLDTSAPLPAMWIATPSLPPLTADKPPLYTVISSHDFLRVALASFPLKTLAFVTGAATDLLTHRRNASAYADITLRPRALIDVSSVRIHTSILGHRVQTPIFCAPTGNSKSVHPDGELALGRACSALGAAQVVSTAASYSLSEVIDATKAASSTPHPIFFQLYVDRDRAKSERFLRAAAARGHLAGVFVTVDAPVVGKREADQRAHSDAANPRALGPVRGHYIDSSLAWDDLRWVRAIVGAEIPILLKGVQSAADAVRAVRAGVQGIVVSNHGGRSLDTAPASVLVLLELQRCCPEVFDKVEVFVDGGIMRGTDVFKALCLGARAVGVGRGFLYGLNYGEEGVKRFIEIMNDELETTMKNCGVTSLDQVYPGLLNTRAVDHLIPDSLSEEHPYAKWRPRQSKL